LSDAPTLAYLLTTKISRPHVVSDLVARPRVYERLERGRRGPLTLVSAPAGFGKTTLLADWLAACDCPYAWLSLDESESDLFQFISYLLAAIRIVFPNWGARTQALLQLAALPTPDVLAAALNNDIEALRDDPSLPPEKRFVLALDDYHLVHNPFIDELLGDLLRHPPSTLHLVVSTRQDPWLPLTRLRAQNQLTEVRAADLRFTAAEIRDFMRNALGLTLEQPQVAILEERTEGWAAGLRLAALSLSDGDDVAGRLADFSTDDRYVMDFLLSEVLARFPPTTQDFLLKTAVLNRLSGPLWLERAQDSL
jgi:LuxR family maltose regulon positive regulatory protein